MRKCALCGNERNVFHTEEVCVRDRKEKKDMMKRYEALEKKDNSIPFELREDGFGWRIHNPQHLSVRILIIEIAVPDLVRFNLSGDTKKYAKFIKRRFCKAVDELIKNKKI